MKHQTDTRSHPEVQRIFDEQFKEIHIRGDRCFAVLLLIQWVVSIFLGICISSGAWVGPFTRGGENGLVGLIFGGLFFIPAAYCILVFPGHRLTRYLVAVSQMCFSILFIHLCGGRPEAHFHVFVSLAALAFYKDTWVLWLAAAVVLADHLLRGHFFPLSIYGQVGFTHWRWIEHGAWVLVENIILMIGIGGVRHELREMACSKYQLMLAKEEALRLSSHKSSFLSNMSHEIRTPLSSIIGFTDILRDTRLDAEQSLFVGTIHRCSESLLHLINDILDISKIENGLMYIDRHGFDLWELHRDIHSIFALKCQEKGLSLQIDIDERVPGRAIGDSHRIRQVLMNLVSNAVKFTDRGGVHIRLHLKQGSEPYYQWQISDTGRGIRSENMSRLFNRFSQEDSSISRHFGGSGLGLMISKNLVELMGGRIFVESRLGEGTTFFFTLPYDKP